MDGPEPSSVVAGALARAGILGITPKQIAATTRLPLPRVEAELRSLSEGNRIDRVGRGLWVLSRWVRAPDTAVGFRSPEWYATALAEETGTVIGTFPEETRVRSSAQPPIHRWWPYVQGFSAEFVARMMERYVPDPRMAVVLDPYCGSGTVPVVARLRGARAVGIDLLPIAAFAAEVKQHWDVDPGELRALAQQVTRPGADPVTAAAPFLKETRRQFSSTNLRALRELKGRIWALGASRARATLQLAFASILIDASRLKRAPCLGYARTASRSSASVPRLFRSAVARIAADLEHLNAVRSSWGAPAKVVLGDSRMVDIRANSVDLAITSPPYVNGMDYVMNYKIDLAWMDMARSYSELSALKSSMVACDNLPRGAVLAHVLSPLVAQDPWISQVSSDIAEHIRTKSIYRRADMGQIVAKYFDDLLPTIRNVLSWLRPGGRFVVVNGDSLMAGTYVPGDLIFARLAARLGFEVESLGVSRIRRSGQRRGFLLRESVLTLRKPGGPGKVRTRMSSVRRPRASKTARRETQGPPED